MASEVERILRKKCAFKDIPIPTFETLKSHEKECAAGWEQQLKHQLQTLPPFDTFWRELPDFFNWLYEGASNVVPLKSFSAQQGSVLTNSSPVLNGYKFTPQEQEILDKIYFATSNYLCVRIHYRKEDDLQKSYFIEPYSLKKTSSEHLLLHALKHETKESRAFRIDRILKVQITDKSFRPSYQIELILRNMALPLK